MLSGIVVTSRFDSRRLPGKALRPIAGRPLLGRVIDQVRKVRGADGIVVATTSRAIDAPIVDLARSEGVETYEGSPEDVASRCLGCADRFGFARLVRICGDSPFIDPDLVASLLARQAQTGADVVTNVMPRTYPPGLSVEVIARAALARVVVETSDPQDREHVTRHFYAHPERFRIENFPAPAHLSGRDVRLAVDTEEDWRRACWIAARASEASGERRLEELIELAEAWDARFRAREAEPGSAEALGHA